MSNIDIIRAWKDEDYCSSLTEEQRSQLPENPAGIIELSDEDMESVAGGTWFGCGSFFGCGGGLSNNCSNNCGNTPNSQQSVVCNADDPNITSGPVCRL
jgi:mersacidin/lichenicidin family type 2 lantibiotic